MQIVRIRTNRGSHHTEEGAYQEALAELGAAIEVAELVGSETFGALAYANRGDTYMRMGRLDDALRDLRRAQDIWERLGSELVDYALGQLGDVQALRGQRSDALALYRQAIEIAERRGDVQGLVPALIGQARVLVDDDVAAAAAAAERAIAASQAVWRPTPSSPPGWVELRRGDRAGAARPADEALRLGHAHQDRPAVAEALLLQAAIEQPPSATHRRGGGAPVGRPRQPDRRGPRRPAASPRRAPGRARDELLADRRAAAVRRRRVGLPGRGPAGVGGGGDRRRRRSRSRRSAASG